MEAICLYAANKNCRSAYKVLSRSKIISLPALLAATKYSILIKYFIIVTHEA